MTEADATVHIVEDDSTQRELLALHVRSLPVQVRGYASCEEFLSTYAPGPGCLLLDVRMEGMSGLALQKELIRRGWLLPVIIVTADAKVDDAVTAMKSAAFDFLQKPVEPERIRELVLAALEVDRQRRTREESTRAILDRYQSLTPRERQVLALVVQGHANKQVGATLSISEKTVEVHRGHVMRKMQATSLAELVRMSLHCPSEQ